MSLTKEEVLKKIVNGESFEGVARRTRIEAGVQAAA